MSASAPPRWSVADYLAMERRTPEKHEFHDGVIIQQAGGSRNHAVISANVVSSLHQQLRSRPCVVFGSDMRVALPRARRYVYPDISVVCTPPFFEDPQDDTLTNPTAIIEILSPSTERYDRGKKFQAYQTLDSFAEYLLIAQDAVLVEHFVRHSEALWTFEVVTDLTATVTLTSIQCALRLDDVYAKVLLDQ